MRATFWMVLGGFLLLGVLRQGLGQPWFDPASPGKGKKPKEDKPKEEKPKKDKRAQEEEKVRKGVAKASKPIETERDKVLKEVLKRPAPPNGSAPADEYEAWFDRLSGGEPIWRFGSVSNKPGREVFERIANRLGLDAEITREQFVRYAREYLAEGSSPSWKPAYATGPLADADKFFRDLDRDGDRVLREDEMSDGLRADRGKWDHNRDGVIDLAEYMDYFQNRVREVIERAGLPGDAPDAPASGSEERGAVSRYGHLSPDLPGWYRQLDADGDCQVGLYEWKTTGRPVQEFRVLDANYDGFITVGELLRYLEASAPKLAGPIDSVVTNAGFDPGGKGKKGDKQPRAAGTGPFDGKKSKGPKGG